jgi:hypothetical protein
MCRSGCRTKDHASWGECARAARLSIGDVHAAEWAAGDREVESYKQARRDGLSPEGIYQADVDKAYRMKETDDAVSDFIAEG